MAKEEEEKKKKEKVKEKEKEKEKKEREGCPREAVASSPLQILKTLWKMSWATCSNFEVSNAQKQAFALEELQGAPPP